MKLWASPCLLGTQHQKDGVRPCDRLTSCPEDVFVHPLDNLPRATQQKISCSSVGCFDIKTHTNIRTRTINCLLSSWLAYLVACFHPYFLRNLLNWLLTYFQCNPLDLLLKTKRFLRHLRHSVSLESINFSEVTWFQIHGMGTDTNTSTWSRTRSTWRDRHRRRDRDEGKRRRGWRGEGTEWGMRTGGIGGEDESWGCGGNAFRSV